MCTSEAPCECWPWWRRHRGQERRVRALASVQEPTWAPTQHPVVRPPRLLSPHSVLSAHVHVDPDMCWARCHARWELRASWGPDDARRMPNPTEKAALMDDECAACRGRGGTQSGRTAKEAALGHGAHRRGEGGHTHPWGLCWGGGAWPLVRWRGGAIRAPLTATMGEQVLRPGLGLALPPAPFQNATQQPCERRRPSCATLGTLCSCPAPAALTRSGDNHVPRETQAPS